GGGDLLRNLHALANAESKLSGHKKRLSEIEEKINDLRPLQKKFMDLKAQLELKSCDLSLFESRAEQNEHHKLSELVKRIEQEVLETKSSCKEKQILYEKYLKTVSLLEKSIKDHANNRGDKLKDLEKRIKSTKAQMQTASKDLNGHENERERLVMEKEAIIKEHASLESQLASLQKQKDGLTVELDAQKNKAQSDLNSSRMKIKECDLEISTIMKDQQKLQSKLSDMNLEKKKMENEVLFWFV
ncbi:hypothetical protein RJ641_033335, partial [Dillenia turbinata]